MSPIEIFGFISFWFILIRLTIWAFIPLWRHLRPINSIWRPSANNWAIVTGGTDGIGLAYCQHLASIGYPLLIISRNYDKLVTVKDQLKQQFGIKCPPIRILAFDFSINDIDGSHYRTIEDEIQQLRPGRVDVLINNVGVSFANADYFTVIAHRSPDLMSKMINVNVVSALMMTRMVWNEMLEQNRGIILNIGSQSALNPIPLLALYSATKAFVDYFTHTLVIESRDHSGVIVQSVLPGFVATKMSHLRPSFNVPTADVFVRSAMSRVGRSNRTFGYWWHTIIGIVYEFFNHTLGSDFNSRLAFNILHSYRVKYYRYKKIRDLYNDPIIDQ
ncbi:hypothetical protein RDWZM_010443 [Blomia tropicalis]|uniref:Uncharacterized protein n=1 Tax=Blomia tropicalis TaxID=40697 RepID=A0A9Q0LWR7_BLOTA|nr:hypothetical protein BLOT_010275 [Blomia tropicalis]KAJ6215943.1 hypothetical protein RDWZM_010443 [Blomia tropicalis]